MTSKVEPFDAKVAWSPQQDNAGESVGSLWTDFAQNTGFHGVNKLTVGRNYKFRCFWWTIAILAMSVYMSYSVTKEVLNYYEYPTVTSGKIELVQEMPFPAVTICSQSPFNLSKLRETDPALEYYFKKQSFLGSFTGPLNWSNPIFGPNFYEPRSVDWWTRIAMDPEDLLYMCTMKGKLSFPCKTQVVLTSYGLCATLNSNASKVELVQLPGSDNNMIVQANIFQAEYVYGSQLSAGLKVFLHDPSVHPDAATSSFIAAPGTATNAVITRRKNFLLVGPVDIGRVIAGHVAQKIEAKKPISCSL